MMMMMNRRNILTQRQQRRSVGSTKSSQIIINNDQQRRRYLEEEEENDDDDNNNNNNNNDDDFYKYQHDDDDYSYYAYTQEDDDYYYYQDDDYFSFGNDFLMKYNLKFMKCKPGLKTVNPRTHEIEYGIVVIRLCPTVSFYGGNESLSCDSTTNEGCSTKYGEIVVSIKTYVESFLGEYHYYDHNYNNNENENDDNDNENDDNDNSWQNMYGSISKNLYKYSQCQPAYYNDDDTNNNNAYYTAGYYDDDYNNKPSQLYIGPTCTNDGKGIRRAYFKDSNCRHRKHRTATTTQQSNNDETTTDNSNSNNNILLFMDGGLVSTDCLSCISNEDNDEDSRNELRSMCSTIYDNAAYKCESNMVHHPNAKIKGCRFIKKQLSSSTDGVVGHWIIVVFAFVGLGLYCYWCRRRRKNNNETNEELSKGILYEERTTITETSNDVDVVVVVEMATTKKASPTPTTKDHQTQTTTTTKVMGCSNIIKGILT